jgi:hypothetical protein
MESSLTEACLVMCLQPTFHSRDHKGYWEWRVRNVPYPKVGRPPWCQARNRSWMPDSELGLTRQDVFSVTVDDAAQQLILRTTNKKWASCIASVGGEVDPEVHPVSWLSDSSSAGPSQRFGEPASR